MMVKLKARWFDDRQMKTMYVNPMQVASVEECDAKTCYMGINGIEDWLVVDAPVDAVACKVSAAMEEML